MPGGSVDGAAAGHPTHAGPSVGSIAERRVCTVLFTDLVGFTPLSESRDPEEVRELLSRYFEAARTVVGRYGGAVEKFIGDAVMAVWGTPVASEGDAERAVRAGLDIVDAVSLLGDEIGAAGLRARAGVVTGEIAVTVGLVGEGIAGDAVNTAARVQTVAAPGEVWVDDATHRLAGAAIGFGDRGMHALKGKSEPIHLWQATRVLSGRGGSQRIDGLEAPLFGRDAELRTVKELFHATAERGAPRLVVVSGPAGVGKSRLGWEFEKYVDGLADEIWWHRGRCLSYGEGVAFWALAEIVRQRFAIAEEDPTDVAGEKLRTGLADFVPDADERAYVSVRLARLLGVPSDDDAGTLGREELFAGWRLFFERLAATNPVVLLVEDGQHADAGLLDFLDHLADWARDAPIFMLVLTRPELAETRPGWGIGRNRNVLTLDPLDAASMDAVVDALVPGMPADVRAAIGAQAQGVPLFAVETIRSLIDRDVVVPRDGVYHLVGDIGELTVPDSLRSLLAARLDSLDDAMRALVADAAVLGSTFPVEALVAVSGADHSKVRKALDELVRRQVFEISADPLSPQRGNYAFTHNLLRQVAYETMSRRERKTRHLAVAAHLRATFAGDGDEVIDIVARHYQDALAAVPGDEDVDEVRTEACAALVRAAERATRSGAPQSAGQNFTAAAALTAQSEGRDDATQEAAQLWERAAWAYVVAGDADTAIDLSDRAADCYSALGRTRAAARARAIGGQGLSNSRRHSEARQRLSAALEVLRVDPDQDTVTALATLSSLEVLSGGPGADRLTAEALVLGQALDVDIRQLATLFIGRGIAFNFANRHDEATASLEYAVRLAEQAQDSVVLGRALLNLATELASTDPSASAAAARASCDQCRRAGAKTMLATAVANLVNALVLTGEWEQAARVLDEASSRDGLDTEDDLIQSKILLASFRGDADRARELASAADFSEDDVQDRAARVTAEILVAAVDDRLADVVNSVRELLTVSGPLGIRHEMIVWSWPIAVRAAEDLQNSAAAAELIAALDAHPVGHLPPLLRAERELALARSAPREEAERRFAAAVALLRRFGSPYHLARGLVDQASFLARSGDPEAARALTTEAVGIAAQLGAAPLLRRAQEVEKQLETRVPAG
ncbi:MAG TPA: adenylate/guanylate cyclase domain-containing protein [Jatrophihabitans sp.]|nr:adenylate/guanylate cyclase domain-containing protein [Jatrophihabitans sp.]